MEEIDDRWLVDVIIYYVENSKSLKQRYEENMVNHKEKKKLIHKRLEA